MTGSLLELLVAAKKFRGTDGGTEDANHTQKVRISSFSSGENNPVRGFVIGQIQMNSKTITNLSQSEHKNCKQPKMYHQMAADFENGTANDKRGLESGDKNEGGCGTQF